MKIDFTNDISKEQNQVYIALGGSKEFMVEELLDIIVELKTSYGKPIQGNKLTFKGVRHVITPVWNSKPY
jgi:hypothetical protein